MGNCCGGPEEKDDNPNQNLNAYNIKFADNSNDPNNICEGKPVDTPPMRYGNDPSQYKTASRDEIAAAAERRLAQQKQKSEIKNLKPSNADLPGPNTGQGGLRWQVG